MQEMKFSSWIKGIGTLLIVIAVLAISFINYWPNLKEDLKLLNTNIDYNNYQTMIEFDFLQNEPSTSNETGCNFSFIIDKNNKVSNILYFNSNATLIHNENIEKKSISKAIDLMIQKLYKEQMINNTTLVLTNYGSLETYSNIKEEINKYFVAYAINCEIKEETSTLLQKANELNINSTNEEKILSELNNYSLNIISNKKTKISVENNLTSNEVKKYADNVYEALQNYAITNNITNETTTDASVPIQLVSSGNSEYYPNEESWYYIKENKVFAYIKFTRNNETFDYCYKGSKENYKEGKC